MEAGGPCQYTIECITNVELFLLPRSDLLRYFQ